MVSARFIWYPCNDMIKHESIRYIDVMTSFTVSVGGVSIDSPNIGLDEASYGTIISKPVQLKIELCLK